MKEIQVNIVKIQSCRELRFLMWLAECRGIAADSSISLLNMRIRENSLGVPTEPVKKLPQQLLIDL
jgi:hypothetical protein